MTIGFNDGIANRIPDRAMTKQSTPRILLAQFGDGYEQRLPLGINSLAQEYGVTFKNREKEEIDDIASFLDSTKGATSFSFTVPNSNATGGEETIKVVCSQYSKSYDYGDYYSLDATFRRVYEP